MCYLLPCFRRDSLVSTVELWVLYTAHFQKYCAVVPRRWYQVINVTLKYRMYLQAEKSCTKLLG